MESAEKYFYGCRWIGGERECESPVIMRRFTASKATKAELFITALGFFEARINGIPVTAERFLPVVSDFEPRRLDEFLYPLKDETVNRLYCYKFDITELLRDGENLLQIHLGNGWYRQTERTVEGPVYFGDTLKTVFAIVSGADGKEIRICSDGSELWRESEILYSNLFIGEVIDPRVADGEAKRVTVYPSPKTALTMAMGTADKEIRKIIPKCIGAVNGRKIYDLGENISGVVRARIASPTGSRAVLRFAENLGADGGLDFHSVGASYKCASGRQQIMQDEFISDGKERVFEPKFVWHAFRYFDVEGDVESVEVAVIHADTPIISSFSSGSEGLNFLYEGFLRTQLINMHGSIPSDCPHRERLGYTGDGQICAPAAMMMLDSRDFYEKWIQDILDCQDVKSGHVQHTAPIMGGGGGPGGWGGAIVLVPYAFYREYGEVDILRKCYQPMLRWVDYLCTRLENGLITHEEEGGWCLGDWCTLEKPIIPAPYVNTCYFVKSLRIMEEIAAIIERPEDIQRLCELRGTLEAAIRENYREKDGISFCEGVQGADAYAVWCGIAGEENARLAADKYRALGHFDTGFLGTDILCEVLFTYGYGDVAYRLLSGEELGSFLYMKRHGATTIWEDWKGRSSHAHPMFGGCARHLFSSVLGIRQRPGTAGYSDIIISPVAPHGLDRAEGYITTPNGRITVKWERVNGELKVYFRAPVGVRCEYKGE